MTDSNHRVTAATDSKSDAEHCLFCPFTNSPRTGEHVIPQWLQEHLGVRSLPVTPTTFDTDTLDAIVSRSHPLGVMSVNQVCGRCNNDWMSRLESDAKPILIRLISGDRTLDDLSDAERVVVAGWAVKTAMVIDYASGTHKVPRAHRHAIGPAPTLWPQGLCVVAWQRKNDKRVYFAGGPAWDRFYPHEPVKYHGDHDLAESAYKVTTQFGDLIITVAFWPDMEHWHIGREANLHHPLWWPADHDYWRLLTNPEPVPDTDGTVLAILKFSHRLANLRRELVDGQSRDVPLQSDRVNVE